MSSDPDMRWLRGQRLDAGRVAAAVADQVGINLLVEGPCPGGQMGAAYVRWPDGRRSVLTCRPWGLLAELAAGPRGVTERLHKLGYPAPRIELAVQLENAVALVHQLLPGTKIDHLDAGLLEQVLTLNALQTGVLATLPEIRPVDLHLVHDGLGYCLHEPLRTYSRRSALLEQWIAEVGAEYPSTSSGHDAVHFDFHPGNLLAEADRVTGVVDWDDAARGDRRFDLVTLRFKLLPKSAAPNVVSHLDEILNAMPPEILRPAWAHMSLRMIDWAIRHFAASEVEQWIDRAEQRAF